MNLFNLASRGVGWNFLGTLIRSVLGLVQLGMLSRYLSAAELGTYSQFFVVTNIALLLMDFGLTAASISKGELTHEQNRQLGFCYVLTGLVTATGTALLAPGISWLMGNAQLAVILPAFAPALLMAALGQFAMMQSQKVMHFTPIVVAETLAALVTTVLVAVGVEMDWREWTFVVAMGMGQVTRMACLLLLFGGPSLALWRIHWRQCQQYFHYGWQFTGGNLISMLVTSLDIILISRLLGLEQTGQYGVIKDLVFRISRMVRPILGRVTLPFYANLQSSPHLGKVYCYSAEVLGLIVAPVYVFFAVFPALSIELLLGSQWLGLSWLLQLLAGWMVLRLIMSQSGVLLSSVGKVRQSLIWNICVACVYPLAIVFGALYGLHGVALAVLMTQLVLFFPHWLSLLRPLSVPIGLYMRVSILPVALSLLALLPIRGGGAQEWAGFPYNLIVVLVLAGLLYSPLVYWRLKYSLAQLRQYTE